MPQVAESPRKASRTTIIKDDVPAPPLPAQAGIFPETEEPEGTPGAWPGGAFDAFDYLRRIKPDDWNNHMVYLYWQQPGLRRLGPYIEVITEPITPDWVKKKFGGSGAGRFTLWVNYVGLPQWHRATDFEIEGERIFTGKPITEANPSAPANEMSQVVSLLREMMLKLGSVDPNAEAAARRGLEMQAKAYDTSLQTMAAKPPGDSQSKILEILLTGMMGLLTALVSKPQAGGMEEAIKLLKDLGVLAKTDMVGTIEGMGKALAAIKGIAGEDAGTGEDFKTVIARGVFQHMPTFQAMAHDLARAAEFNARAASSQPGGPTSSNDQSTLNREQTARNPAIEIPPPAPAGTQAPPPDLTDFLFDRVAKMIADDMEGDDIGLWLKVAAPEFIPQLAQFTEGGLLTLLDGQPAIKAALEGKDSYLLARQLLHFCKTGQEWPEEEDEPEPPIPGATSE